MHRPPWAPAELDLDRPSSARVYDYYLGGSHNFAVDRKQAMRAVDQWPELPAIMHENRAFLRRAVRFCARSGIRQFLDVGSGIPTVGNVHEVAQAIDPQCRTGYVDIDPVAVAHGTAILADTPHTTMVQADMRQPGQILEHPALLEVLDLDQPVALLFVAMLQFVAAEDDPSGLVRQYADAVAPGSYVVISHGSCDGQPERALAHEELYEATGTPIWMRPHEEILTYFAGFELIEPGLVFLTQWRPDSPEDEWDQPERLSGYAGVGVKR